MLTLVSILLFVLSSGFLVWFFLRNDRGSREPKEALFAAAGFGLLAVGAAAWAELLFLPTPTSARTATVSLLVLSLLVGAIEEVAKFGPLALFIRNKGYFNEHTDGVIYFGIAGLTFGFVENLVYLLFKSHEFGNNLTGIFRLVILFFFHAATTGIVGYYFAKAKIQRQSIARPLIALGAFALIHGLYDFLLFFAASTYQRNYGLVDDSGAALITIALVGGLIVSTLLNTFLFLYYRRARQWDVSVGLASDPKLAAQANYYAQPPATQPVPMAPTQTASAAAPPPQHKP